MLLIQTDYRAMHAEDKTKRCRAISIIWEYWVDKGYSSNYVEVAASFKGFPKARAAGRINFNVGCWRRARLSLSLLAPSFLSSYLKYRITVYPNNHLRAAEVESDQEAGSGYFHVGHWRQTLSLFCRTVSSIIN